MIIDLTEINKKLLIRSLYDMASPIGLGVAKYNVKKHNGEKVHDISDSDCDLMLRSFVNINEIDHNEAAKWLDEDENPIEYGSSARIADYINGVPLKLSFFRPYNDFSKIYAYSDAYDFRNGLYRFLETLIRFFPLTDFRVVNKNYPDFWNLEEINDDNGFDKERFKALQLVIDNLSIRGCVDKHVLKSINYFNGFFVDI